MTERSEGCLLLTNMLKIIRLNNVAVKSLKILWDQSSHYFRLFQLKCFTGKKAKKQKQKCKSNAGRMNPRLLFY